MSNVKQYRKKPVVIEAMQMPMDTRNGDPSTDEYHAIGSEMASGVQEIAVWMAESGYDGNPDGEDMSDWAESDVHRNPDGALVGLADYGINYLEISTLEGVMMATPGDWIIKGTEGEFYPCKPAAFISTFEEVR